MGDGILAEFGSVVEAVLGAAEIQREIVLRNRAPFGGKGMELRIGVHVGDIMIDGDDIYGDGVNIASRLEGIAVFAFPGRPSIKLTASCRSAGARSGRRN